MMIIVMANNCIHDPGNCDGARDGDNAEAVTIRQT